MAKMASAGRRHRKWKWRGGVMAIMAASAGGIINREMAGGISLA
jgi:hypothetical protein